MKITPLRAPLALLLCVLGLRCQAEVTVEESDAGAVVKIDGDLFAEYLTLSGHQPAVWPIIGPSGQRVTRAYPLGERGPAENNDHPHHRSLWFSHGIVNDADFWLEPRREGDALIEHKEFTKLEGGADQGVIVTRNDWLARGEKLLSDQRTLVFSELEGGERLIDFTIELRAADKPVTFGDTKEGTFAVRVAGTMKVDARRGGKIINSAGQTNADAWGRPADWVDYTGPAGDTPTGLAIFSSPENFRHPSVWHVRTYGLFTANPFGARDFPPSDAPQGAVTIDPGESLKLRYFVLLHDGDKSPEQLNAIYQRLTSR